jgi:hypothetical protein
MKTRVSLGLAALLGLGAGFALALCVREPEARAAEVKTPRQLWEYKIISTWPHPREGSARVERPRDTVKRLDKEFNQLAAEGWEYRGRVFVGADNATFALFQRRK